MSFYVKLHYINFVKTLLTFCMIHKIKFLSIYTNSIKKIVSLCRID